MEHQMIMKEQKEGNERKHDSRRKNTHLTNIHRQRLIDRSEERTQIEKWQQAESWDDPKNNKAPERGRMT